eukprot:TRINITY_DN17564_c0_g1_i3.p2 TRINITY_DN17564_c0_g1~~TRINITY_DN17564_c0_g1_i3.p2  ORF type:complete len:132 (+),score=43.45 TRINITY_DN17564_c0_g1_i3:84-479(+)
MLPENALKIAGGVGVAAFAAGAVWLWKKRQAAKAQQVKIIKLPDPNQAPGFAEFQVAMKVQAFAGQQGGAAGGGARQQVVGVLANIRQGAAVQPGGPQQGVIAQLPAPQAGPQQQQPGAAAPAAQDAADES